MFLPPADARADVEEWTVVKLLVNVLNDVLITRQDITDQIEEANKILKQAKIRLEWDPQNLQPQFSDGGNNDGRSIIRTSPVR